MSVAHLKKINGGTKNRSKEVKIVRKPKTSVKELTTTHKTITTQKDGVNQSKENVKIVKKQKSSVKELTTDKTTTAQKSHAATKFKKPLKGKERKITKRKPLSKRERRQLKLKSKRHSDLVIKLLPKWEMLRREDTAKEERFEIIESMLKVTKKKLVDFCMAHDTARIIECAIQHGTEAQRWEIFSQMKSSLRLMSKSRYAKHIVLKLIKYGAKEHRLEILKVFRGHVARLVKHRIASEVVDLLYNDYANATQRTQLMQELYGNVHALKLAENQVHTLAEALALNPDRRTVMLHNLTELLTSLSAKGLTKYSIVQHLLLEYLQVQATNAVKEPVADAVTNNLPDSGNDEPKIKAKETQNNFLSLLETLVDGQIVPMLHTREGVRAALHTLWASPLRLRKTLVKGLKTCVSSIARDEHGHLFLIGLLDAVDDIVLLEKIVIREIVAELELFCIHPEARKVLLYALSPRDSRHFSPQLQQSLFAPGDSNEFTKKPLGVRALELRSPSVHLLPKLLELAAEKLTELFAGDTSESGRLALEDRGRLVLLCEILLRSAPHHLDAATVSQTYHRSTDNSIESTTGTTAPKLTTADLDRMQSLRSAALVQLVRQLLVPEFRPLGSSASAKGQSGQTISRNELRMKRHRKALVRAEQSLVSQNKPSFAPFESGEPMDTAESDEDDEFDSPLNPDAPVMSFVERPEGQLLLRWLLQDGRTHKDYTLGRLIVEHVSASTLHAWTRCNRSCFVLVNLYELGDPQTCRALRTILGPCKSELSLSPLPGAKVLLKHLQAETPSS